MGTIAVRRASDIEAAERTWLHEPYVPGGALTLVCGDVEPPVLERIALTLAEQGSQPQAAGKVYGIHLRCRMDGRHDWTGLLWPGDDDAWPHEEDIRTSAELELAIERHKPAFVLANLEGAPEWLVNTEERARYFGPLAIRTGTAILMTASAWAEGFDCEEVCGSTPRSILRVSGKDHDLNYCVQHVKSNYSELGPDLVYDSTTHAVMELRARAFLNEIIGRGGTLSTLLLLPMAAHSGIRESCLRAAAEGMALDVVDGQHGDELWSIPAGRPFERM